MTRSGRETGLGTVALADSAAQVQVTCPTCNGRFILEAQTTTARRELRASLRCESCACRYLLYVTIAPVIDHMRNR